MVNLKTIGQVSNTSPAFIGMSDDDNFMAPVYKFLMKFIRLYTQLSTEERLC